jgi:hypothetical protein
MSAEENSRPASRNSLLTEDDFVATTNFVMPNCVGSPIDYVPLSDMENYNRDPDLYVAFHCGMTKADYYEWLDYDGQPRCGGQRKDGGRCNAIVSGDGDFARLHRRGRCHAHAKDNVVKFERRQS